MKFIKLNTKKATAVVVFYLIGSIAISFIVTLFYDWTHLPWLEMCEPLMYHLVRP